MGILLSSGERSREQESRILKADPMRTEGAALAGSLVCFLRIDERVERPHLSDIIPRECALEVGKGSRRFGGHLRMMCPGEQDDMDY